jgi:hypothetical protein
VNRLSAATCSGVLAANLLAPAAGAVGMESGFVTPSGNIACEADLNPNGTRALHCVLFSASGTRGQKTWSMRTTGRAIVRYVQANVATETPILRYGKTWRWHRITCTSRTAGLTCRNVSGHGWFLSRQRQRIF